MFSLPNIYETLRGDHCAVNVVINGLNKESTGERNELLKKNSKGKSKKKKSKEN